MKPEDIQFPVYRKYRNGKNYFKISSPSEFEELQVIGNLITHRSTKALQYPEKLFIRDLIFNDGDKVIVSTPTEFDGILAKRT